MRLRLRLFLAEHNHGESSLSPIDLQDHESRAPFSGAHALHLHPLLVCRWPHRLPPLLDHHKSGTTIFFLKTYIYLYLFVPCSNVFCFCFLLLNFPSRKIHQMSELGMKTHPFYHFLRYEERTLHFFYFLFADMQTTYENFRYRYDKKENPYNKGFLRNLKDVFSSKIPPSMHDFRSWVIEETPPSTPNIGVDVIGRAEMGTSEPAATDAIPPLLRNLDSNRTEDGEDVKARHEAHSAGGLVFPVVHSPFSSIDSPQSYRGDNGGSADEAAGEEVDESEHSKESSATHTKWGDTGAQQSTIFPFIFDWIVLWEVESSDNSIPISNRKEQNKQTKKKWKISPTYIISLYHLCCRCLAEVLIRESR